MSSPGAKAAMGRLLLICNDSKIIEQLAKARKFLPLPLKSVARSTWPCRW